MRKLLTLSFLGLLLSSSTGCECWDCFMRFENWKNQTLFGCCASNNNCDPCAQQYQYAPIGCAGVAGYGGDCAGVVGYGGMQDYGGISMEAPCADGSCTSGGCGPGGCAPAQGYMGPGNIYAPVPGQMMAPQVITTPGVIGPAPGVVPAPTL